VGAQHVSLAEGERVQCCLSSTERRYIRADGDRAERYRVRVLGGAGIAAEIRRRQVLREERSVWSRLFYKGLRDANVALDYDEAVVRSALKWLEYPPERPWVLFMPLLFPHCPFQVEEPYFSMFDRDSMPKLTKPAQKTGYEPRYMEVIRREYGCERATPEVWAEIAATYHGMISRLDDQFSRVVSKVKEARLWDNTVIMFFTGHAEYLGDHRMIEKWSTGLSDCLLHEPLIIGGGGLPFGKINNNMAEMVDLVPTVFQLCGIDETFAHDGNSLLSTMLEGKAHKNFAYLEGGFLLFEEPVLEQAPYPYDIKAGLQHGYCTGWEGHFASQ
jgi:arylsulfatase A-like enzyme